MRAAVGEISDEFVGKSSFRLSTKNAWAKYVRNRWPLATVGMIQAEWALTEGEAKGLVYAQASQTTIDKILEHPNGGFALGLEILAMKTATTLENYIAAEARKARHERERAEARERDLAALKARVSERRSWVGRRD